MTTVLREPFNNFVDNAWATSFVITPSGRNGSGAQATGTSECLYAIPSAVRDSHYVCGFAYNPANFALNQSIMQFRLASANNFTVLSDTTGAIQVRRGTVTGTILGTSAAATLVVGTWSYIEIDVVISDTGTFTVLNNGSIVLDPTAADTMVSAPGSLMDQFVLAHTNAGQPIYDDVYLLSGSGVTPLGSQIITTAFPGLDTGVSGRMIYPQRRMRTRRTG